MRALLPLLALVGLIALPTTLAQTPAEKKSTPSAPMQPSRPTEPSELAIIRLTNSGADRIAKMLSEIFSLGMFRPGGSLRVVADAQTNSLVLTGSAVEIATARGLIKDLDQPPVELAKSVVIRLKHGRAAEVAELVRQAAMRFTPTGPSTQISAIADERTSSLVITGTEPSRALIRSLIDSVDVPSTIVKSKASTTNVRVTVFGVDVPTDRAGELTSAELRGKAADEKSFVANLAKFGATRHLYTIDQSVDISAKPTIAIGSSVPSPSGTNKHKDGTSTTTVVYQDFSCHVELSGDNIQQDGGVEELRIQVELSLPSDSTITIAPGTNAPIMHKVVQSYGGAYAANAPIVLLTVESLPAKQTSTAYATRIEFTKPAARGS